MTTPIAIWDWERKPQPPSARVVVCRPGLVSCLFGDGSHPSMPRGNYIVAASPAELRRFAAPNRGPSDCTPALYAERQGDLTGAGALLTVNADRRALVLCPREAMDIELILARPSGCLGAWLSGSGGHRVWSADCTNAPHESDYHEPLCRDHYGALHTAVRDEWMPWAPIDLVVIIPPPEARACGTCSGVGYTQEVKTKTVDGLPRIRSCDPCNGSGSIDPWPIHPVWVRGIVEQCREAGVPVAFLGWGRWLPWSQRPMDMALTREMLIRDGNAVDIGGEYAWPVGEERSGRLLGGAEVMDLPEWLT